jgi:8-oxo-dGTP pyrophosphatase MutT (NUDIX family)
MDSKLHIVVVTALVIKDKKVLILRRSPDERMFPGLWTVPGGKLSTDDYVHRSKDTDEYWYNVIEDCVCREVMEEAGVRIKNIRYLTSLSCIRPDGLPCIVLSMYADYADGEVRISRDFTDFAWTDVEDARKYQLIDGIYEELLMLKRVLSGGFGEWRCSV